MPVLRAGDAAAVVDVAGGRVASLTVDGMELLVTEADRPIDRGLFPMVPFAGRIGHGRFTFDGVTHELPANLPPHAIHGTVLEAAWTTVDHAGASWCGTVDLAEPWPFGGQVIHEVILHDDRLVARLEVRNDERPMPVTAGWHPWWTRRLPRGEPLVLDVDLSGARMYERSADDIPTGRLVDPTPRPWDDCFTGLRRPPVLRWPGALSLACETTVDHWMLFTHPEHALCVEPQSGPPDAVNLGRGYAIVGPGRPLVIETTWRWSPG